MRLKVASWNIFGGRDVPGVIRALKSIDADIIGLQEVLTDEDGSNNDAQTIADALGYSWLYAPTELLTPSASYVLTQLGIGKNKWWGNALLSRYPMSGKQVHLLSEVRKRIALEASVAVGGTSLRVFSTHLVHGGAPTALVRLAQAERLLAAVPPSRAIVMGDFNATPESEAVRKMAEVMRHTDEDLVRYTRVAHHERLDYIFTTRDIQSVETGVVDSDASDHLPIYAVIELP